MQRCVGILCAHAQRRAAAAAAAAPVSVPAPSFCAVAAVRSYPLLLGRPFVTLKPAATRAAASSFLTRTGSPAQTRPVGLSSSLPASAAAPLDPDELVPQGLSSGLGKLDRQLRRDAQHALNVSQQPRNKVQQLWHDYGWVGMGTYLGIYVSTLGMLYVAISSGAIGGDTVMRLVDTLGLSDHFSADISPKKGSFVMAWVATKLTEPVRMALAVALTPKIARMVGMAPPKNVAKAVVAAAVVAAKKL